MAGFAWHAFVVAFFWGGPRSHAKTIYLFGSVEQDKRTEEAKRDMGKDVIFGSPSLIYIS